MSGVGTAPPNRSSTTAWSGGVDLPELPWQRTAMTDHTPPGPTRSIEGEAEFRAWIQQETAIRSRAVGDVCSRVRRAATILPPRGLLDGKANEQDLGRDPVFGRCTETVRSHIKRAVRLYLQFRASERVWPPGHEHGGSMP